MASTVAKRLPETPRKMLAMRGEGVRKKLANPDEARALGRVIERAIEIVGSTKQDIADALGYTDQSALSRWISGVETPQMAKLWALPQLKSGLLLAFAEAAGDVAEIDVRTIVTVARRREEVA
jgi:hypothetical protein